jgi:hypothetical protein
MPSRASIQSVTAKKAKQALTSIYRIVSNKQNISSTFPVKKPRLVDNFPCSGYNPTLGRPDR